MWGSETLVALLPPWLWCSPGNGWSLIKTLHGVTTLSSFSTAAGVTVLPIAHHSGAIGSRQSLDLHLWGPFWAVKFSSAYTSADGKKKNIYFFLLL